MTPDEIVEHLKSLSRYDLEDVIEAANRILVERTPKTHDATDNPLFKMAGCLSGDPMTAEEIEEELYGDRRPK